MKETTQTAAAPKVTPVPAGELTDGDLEQFVGGKCCRRQRHGDSAPASGGGCASCGS